MKPIAELDFETKAIDSCDYPPSPVGVAISLPSGESWYWAWGHSAGGNNIDEESAKARVHQISKDYRLGVHHAFFDIAVGRRWGCWDFPVNGFEDSLPLLFLDDPRAPSYALKTVADRVLGIKPNARDKVRDWLKDAGYRAKVKSDAGLGAYISEAPGDLVGEYAKDDVMMTRLVREHYLPKIIKLGMYEAYQRELALTPVLIKMTERGIALDQERLTADVADWQRHLDAIDNWIRRRLYVGPSVNLDSDRELADVLEGAGKINVGGDGKPLWIKTDKGGRSVAFDALEVMIEDKELLLALERRGIFNTCVNTFGLNWLKMAERDGRIHTQWNATRDTEFGSRKGRGASTGRISSSPNLQNILKVSPRSDMPNLRSYLIPTPGRVMFGRDYSQQEIRILAHYEDGALLNQYKTNPRFDIHSLARNIAKERYGLILERPEAKVVIFGILYGMGVGLLAKRLKKPESEAKLIRDTYLAIFPGIAELQADLRLLARKNRPLRTLGGRLYYCKPPKQLPDKRNPKKMRMVSFEYKMLNDTIQPSAADVTKQAMINADNAGVEMLLTVHDEIVAEAELGQYRTVMRDLKDAMESVPLDCPLLSDGKFTFNDWGSMQVYAD